MTTELQLKGYCTTFTLDGTIKIDADLFAQHRKGDNLGRVPNLGRCDIFMKEVQPLGDKHDKLKIEERDLFFSGELIIPTIGVAVRS
jgi:hypothetical protein